VGQQSKSGGRFGGNHRGVFVFEATIAGTTDGSAFLAIGATDGLITYPGAVATDGLRIAPLWRARYREAMQPVNHIDDLLRATLDKLVEGGKLPFGSAGHKVALEAQKRGFMNLKPKDAMVFNREVLPLLSLPQRRP